MANEKRVRPSPAAICKRLARFTAKRPPIKPGDGWCVRQISVYTCATEEIKAVRCRRREDHESPHRFKHPDGYVSECKVTKK